MTDQEQFEEIFTTYITRQGSTELLEWMKKTDFFTAPASTRFHCACKGGLLKHSINVYRVLRERYFEEGDSEESFAICGLLHDICKTQFYKESTRNVKNEQTGQWEKQPYFTVEDSFPYGHGEKSVFMFLECQKCLSLLNKSLLNPPNAVSLQSDIYHMPN